MKNHVLIILYLIIIRWSACAMEHPRQQQLSVLAADDRYADYSRIPHLTILIGQWLNKERSLTWGQCYRLIKPYLTVCSDMLAEILIRRGCCGWEQPKKLFTIALAHYQENPDLSFTLVRKTMDIFGRAESLGDQLDEATQNLLEHPDTQSSRITEANQLFHNEINKRIQHHNMLKAWERGAIKTYFECANDKLLKESFAALNLPPLALMGCNVIYRYFREYKEYLVPIILSHPPYQNPELLKKLVNKTSEFADYYPLFAAQIYHPKVISYLLQMGADATATDNNGNTILHHFADDYDDEETYQKTTILLEHLKKHLSDQQQLAFINTRNNYGKTALKKALSKPLDIDLVVLLITHGTQDIATFKRITRLAWGDLYKPSIMTIINDAFDNLCAQLSATRYGKIILDDTLQSLSENLRCYEHYAPNLLLESVINRLINHGAWTRKMIISAAESRAIDIVKEMLNMIPDTEKDINFLSTILQKIIRFSWRTQELHVVDIVKKLLELGADPCTRSKLTRRPILELAKRKRLTAVAEILHAAIDEKTKTNV
jgi:hypothetical protein